MILPNCILRPLSYLPQFNHPPLNCERLAAPDLPPGIERVIPPGRNLDHFLQFTYWTCTVVATDPGVSPAAKGDPFTSVSAPFVALMLNTETLFDAPFATYKNFPD